MLLDASHMQLSIPCCFELCISAWPEACIEQAANTRVLCCAVPRRAVLMWKCSAAGQLAMCCLAAHVSVCLSVTLALSLSLSLSLSLVSVN